MSSFSRFVVHCLFRGAKLKPVIGRIPRQTLADSCVVAHLLA